MPAKYHATLSQSQGRTGWSVIFRHPGLIDPATEKPGRRVRRGLGTDDERKAAGLVRQLNQLLGEERFWLPSARIEASHRGIDPLVLDIFYGRLTPEERDPFALREELLPVPEQMRGKMKRVLFLGPTGSGKTTLLRHVIGTTLAERFPSTSTAKTTIHDVEILVQPGDYRAAVTFATHDEIEELVKENLVHALFDAAQDAKDDVLLRRILVHVNERMRFNYILGDGPARTDPSPDDLLEDDPDAKSLVDPVPSFGDDLKRTDATLARAVEVLKKLAAALTPQAAKIIDDAPVEDPQLVAQAKDEQFEALARENEQFHALVDGLMDEIQQRFEYLAIGDWKRSGPWPDAWTYATADRQQFLRAVRRFSSNHALLFGQLLTPLVNGMRVAGPFLREWDGETIAPLLLMDGEGLGHSPRTAAAVPTTVMRRVESADYVVLVDNAEQPMQAASAAALKELIASGNLAKLVIAFTHMDEVGGDNLRSSRARREHVLASAEGLAASFRETFGSLSEQSLKRRFEEATFFFGHLDEELDGDGNKQHAATVGSLREFVGFVTMDAVRVPVGPALPVYSILALGFSARRATEEYSAAWGGRLGVVASAPMPREPWQRVKALARRLATPGMGDEYDTLRPVADLRRSLVEALYPWINAPVDWNGTEPSPETRQRIFDQFAEEVARRLAEIAARRVQVERLREWQDAYGLRGRFSTFSRSQKIHTDIVRQAAPDPDVAMSPAASKFLEELVHAVKEAAHALGIELRSA